MSNTTRYGVLIDGHSGGYGVVFPDLPASTVDEALHARRIGVCAGVALEQIFAWATSGSG